MAETATQSVKDSQGSISNSEHPKGVNSLNYFCEFYLNIADQLLAKPEGVVPQEVEDRQLFRLLSDFYLGSGQQPKLNESRMDSSKPTYRELSQDESKTALSTSEFRLANEGSPTMNSMHQDKTLEKTNFENSLDFLIV